LRVRKLEHIRVLKRLGYVKKGRGGKEETYVLFVAGKMEITTDVPKGRDEIPDGTMSKILNWQIHLSQQEYREAQAGRLGPVEYLALLRKKRVLQ
jgi:predicted RNA binding protein YcfA (HicA-like mRNA interferase family)